MAYDYFLIPVFCMGVLVGCDRAEDFVACLGRDVSWLVEVGRRVPGVLLLGLSLRVRWLGRRISSVMECRVSKISPDQGWVG